jgi:OmpA-OmpF porin, OOP family
MSQNGGGPKPAFWIALVLVVFGLVGYGARNHIANLIPDQPEVPSVVPRSVTLPEAKELPNNPSTSPVVPAKVTLPSPKVLVSQSSGCIRYHVWAWNAQMGLMYANGGPTTTPNSIMAKYGLCVEITRQDDTSQMQNEMIKFATELSAGVVEPTQGIHFINIMGDGTAAFFAGLNPQLQKICPDCIAQVIGVVGYSRGEDKFMGPQSWKNNPQNARGGFIAGVLRDGDWNIAQKWAGDNQICSNPDEKTYDPNCINWVNADSYVDAAEKYVTNYCDELPVVTNGKRTGKTVNKCVDAIVTWTPADVTAAQKRGGIVSIVSTKEYRWQMPATIIGNKRWIQSHRATVENILSAVFEAGEIVKNNPAALQKAAEISATVYKEETPAYWLKYYKGVIEKDKTGVPVELGGSTVSNLADNLQLFGMNPGSDNIFKIVYEGFGDVVVHQYPHLVPAYPPVSEILDLSYIAAVRDHTTVQTEAEMPTFDAYKPVTQVVSRRSWQITFETGKATLTSDGERTLEEAYRDIVQTGLAVQVHGHTDNSGQKNRNQQLSEDRAFTVKKWLETKSPTNFSNGRVAAVGHGDSMPVESNSTPQGKATNRRVEIVMGSQS